MRIFSARAAFRRRSSPGSAEPLVRGGIAFAEEPVGTKYQVEIEAVWDDKKGGPLRVIAAIDHGGLRAFAPMSEDFIIAPDGSFVGE